VRVVTDPAGRIETPPLPKPRIAIHLGSSVYVVCQRAGQKHPGLAVHGDIDIVPADTACVWEPNGPDSALIVSINPDVLASTAEELGVSRSGLKWPPVPGSRFPNRAYLLGIESRNRARLPNWPRISR
jgi:hypothetical protein